MTESQIFSDTTGARPVQVSPARLLEGLRCRHPSLAGLVDEDVLSLEQALAEGRERDAEPSSGFRRLRRRHSDLIRMHQAYTNREAELRILVDQVLAENRKLVQAAAAAPTAWFELAHSSLNQLENNPDRLALQTMLAVLAQLQSRLSAIVMKVPL